MGLENLPVCPDDAPYGSKEWGDWYHSLPEESQAFLWVNAKVEKVKDLQATPSIDKEQKIQRVILGGIADATGGIYGAWLLAKGDTKNNIGIISGLKLTWLKSTILIDRLGHFLPVGCRQAYADLFEKFTPFVEKTLDNLNLYNHDEFLDQGWQIYTNLQGISNEPPGIDKAILKK